VALAEDQIGSQPGRTAMSMGTFLRCWSRACFAAVSAPMFMPAKKVEVITTPNSKAANNRQERITLLNT
jgi:hypothetical protein